jgi:hypothetical protein
MSTFGEKSFLAAADLSAKRYHIVKQTSDTEVNLATAATDKIVGTLYNDPVSGQEASVDGLLAGKPGTGLVKLGGTVSYGSRLTTNSDSEAIATTTTGNVVFGIALQEGVDGDLIEYAKVYFIHP